MAEIYLDVELLLEFLVADEKNVVVPGDSFHLRESLLHPLDPVFECPN